MPDPSTTTTCPSCGASASGRFCSSCGTALGTSTCAHCEADLTPGARFCHRCGRPAGMAGTAHALGTTARPSERTPWIVAGALVVLLLGAIGYNIWQNNPTPAGTPDMANAGNAAPGLNGLGPAPDISGMSPRERFDRLFNRVMTAAQSGDTTTVVNFTPMALGAYRLLDTVNIDARYHAAVLRMQVGDFAGATALADTILAESPGHLFGYVIRGTAARLQGDSAAMARARREFAEHYDAELAANRVEYLEHEPVVEEFRRTANSR